MDVGKLNEEDQAYYDEHYNQWLAHAVELESMLKVAPEDLATYQATKMLLGMQHIRKMDKLKAIVADATSVFNMDYILAAHTETAFIARVHRMQDALGTALDNIKQTP